MFRRATQISLFSLAVVTLLWGVFLTRVRETDLVLCQNKLDMHKQSGSKSLFETTHQYRKGVMKDIYFVQEDLSRLHYRIESESSVLTLEPRGSKLDMIEKLEKIKCWMQDKLYTSPTGAPMQQMRYFEANEGLYLYATQQFEAQTVALSLFRLPGHALPMHFGSTSPFLKGLAKDVSFGLSGKTPQFKAQQFQAQLQNSIAEGS